MKRVSRAHAAGMSAYRAVQDAKRHATGTVFRALHRSESHLASALGLVSFKKRSTTGKKRSKKAKKEEGNV